MRKAIMWLLTIFSCCLNYSSLESNLKIGDLYKTPSKAVTYGLGDISKDDGNGDGSIYKTRSDVPVDTDITGINYVIDYIAYEQEGLGRFIGTDPNFPYIADKTWSLKSVQTYQSGFFKDDKHWEDVINVLTFTYTFEKYIDIPVEILSNYGVGAYQTRTIDIKRTNSVTKATSTVIEEGHRRIESSEVSGALGTSTKLDLGFLQVDLSSNASAKATTTDENYKTITESSSTSTYFEEVREEVVTLDNSNSSHYTYFQECFRQKFKIYFFASYQYQYNVSEWKSGVFNADTNKEYTPSSILGIDTYYVLVPVDPPYHDISKYYDDASGNRVLFDKYNPSIYYL